MLVKSNPAEGETRTDRPGATVTILHVITGLAPGGAEAMLCQLAVGLAGRGFAQHVVSLKDRGVHAETLEAAGIAVDVVKIDSALDLPAAVFRLARLVRRLRPDVIQGWMYHGNLAATLAHWLAPGRGRRRLLWNIRASNMDDARYRRVIGWSALLSAAPDVVLANSQAGMDFHVARGFRPRKARVIANGIDTEKFRPDRTDRDAVRAELGIAGDKVVAIKVARVDPMKDHANFLAAMERNPDVIGLLVGADTDRLALPRNVKALGFRRDIARLHAAADILVSSSAFGEGFSNAIAEGMASGLVPVVTDVGDARAMVGDAGSVVAPGDPEALATAISAEAARTPADLRERGLRARGRIVEKFTLARAVEAYAALYAPGGDGTVTPQR